jgi:hypothetical protein
VSKKNIEYIFSHEVNAAIDKYVQDFEVSGQKINFYLILGQISCFEDCGNYQISIGYYKNDPPQSVKKSSHYYQSSHLILPITFDYDYAFIGYGTDRKGRVIRKYTIEHYYVIEFNKAGNVIRKGK